MKLVAGLIIGLAVGIGGMFLLPREGNYLPEYLISVQRTVECQAQLGKCTEAVGWYQEALDQCGLK